MKQFVKTFIVVLFTVGVFSSCGTMRFVDKYVNDKITRMQELVGFSEEKAIELKHAEIMHLKALMASCGNDEERQKLKAKKKIWLHNILGEEKSLKYLEIEAQNCPKEKVAIEKK